MPTAPKTHRQPTKPNEKRESPAKRGYGRTWKRIRAQKLAANPLCEDCSARGIIEAATEVDHVDGDSSNNEPSNHRSLCKSCHSRKTVRENGGLGR